MKGPKVIRKCPHGHDVDLTRVSPGRSTDCPACRTPGACAQCPPEGKRVGVRRLKSGPPESAAAAAWDGVPEWDGRLGTRPDDDAPPCQGCGRPMARTPRGTRLECPRCGTSAVPAAVAGRAASAAGRSERAAVAVRDDGAAQLRAELDLIERRAQAAATYRKWAAALNVDDPDGTAEYLPDSLADRARRLRERFAALAVKADRAETPEALATVRQVAAEAITAGQQIEHAVYSARQDARNGELDDELDDDGQDDDGGGYRPPEGARVVPGQVVRGGDYWAEYDARSAAQARQLAERPAPSPRSVTLAPRRLPAASPPPVRIVTNTERLAANGPCHFARRSGGHRVSVVVLGNAPPPATRTVTGNSTGRPGLVSYGAPTIRICGASKCLSLAEVWFKERGYPDCTYAPIGGNR